MGNPPQDRCGYTWPEDFDPERADDTFQQSCCWRESINIKDVDRCIWHADPDMIKKSTEILQATRTPDAIQNQNQNVSELLDGAKLQGTSLPDINLTDAVLREADLSDANLVEADLRDVDLSDANLVEADLGDADLSDANLVEADLRDVGLSDANLVEADLGDADLSGAKLKAADLSGARLWNADLPEADLREADLPGAKIKDADLSEVGLWNADLSGAILKEADLPGAKLWEADLSEAEFYGSDLSEADLREADLPGAILKEADLPGAKLWEADLSDAKLKEADLSGAILAEADLREADLSDAKLKEADLSGAILAEADLRDADLLEADLAGADITGADLRDASISDISMNAMTTCKRLNEGFQVGEAWNSIPKSSDLIQFVSSWPPGRYSLSDASPKFLNRFFLSSKFNIQDWDKTARAYKNMKQRFKELALTGKARRMHIGERRARSYQAKTTGDMQYFRSLPARFITGYGVRVRTLLFWMVLLFLISTAVYLYAGIRDTTTEIIAYSVLAFTVAPPPPLPSGTLVQTVVMIETFLGTLSTVLLGYVLGNREQI